VKEREKFSKTVKKRKISEPREDYAFKPYFTIFNLIRLDHFGEVGASFAGQLYLPNHM
jgi:demethoxyubiquinone hydroxylase (CLK1/Coq7/Cat5 family)